MRVNHSNPGHVRAATIGALCLGGLSGVMATGLMGPFRDAFVKEYEITQSQLGTTLAVIVIVLGFIGIWQGPKLADRIGRYRLLKCSVGMMVIGLTGCGLFTNLTTLAAFWGLFMLGAYLSIIVNAVVTDLWREEPRRGVLLLHTMLSVGKILGPVAAWVCMIYLVQRPWRGFFFFGSAVTLTILVFLSFVRQGKVYHSREDHPWQEAPLARPVLLWLTAALLGLIAGSENALASIAPVFYHQQHDVSHKFASWVLAFHFTALTAGRFLFAAFASKLTCRAIAAISIVPALLIVPAAYSSSPVVSIACFVLAGLGFAAMWPAIFAHMAAVFSQNRSRLTLAVGLMNAAGIAGGIAATSWLIGTRPAVALLFGPAVLILCGLVFVACDRSPAPPADDVPANKAAPPEDTTRAR